MLYNVKTIKLNPIFALQYRSYEQILFYWTDVIYSTRKRI